MEDKTVMHTLLTLSKNMCEILVHGTIESSNVEVKKCFKKALDKYLTIQENIYTLMEEKGWYKLENTTESKIKKAKNKFENVF